MRKGFFDNDILTKLAGINLIDNAIQQLAIHEVLVLASLKPQLTNAKKSGKLAHNFASWPDVAQKRVLDFIIRRTQNLSPEQDQTFIERYLTEYSLGVGEIQLLEAAFRTDNSFLLTGDKRFLEQLVNIPELLGLSLEKLPKRFACFESVLLLLIDRCGFEFVRDRVLQLKEYDGQIKITFGGGESKTKEQAREALIYELERLGEDVARLLHYPLSTGCL